MGRLSFFLFLSCIDEVFFLFFFFLAHLFFPSSTDFLNKQIKKYKKALGGIKSS